jgi:NAD(P)-dependent dehydrogenase (short-subunit alcohol dehydrogenase family)
MSPQNPGIVVKELASSGAAISGGTAGIGLASAEALLAAGVPRVVVFGRNPDRGARAVARLRELAPDATVEFVPADCHSVDSAQAAIAQAEEILDGIDVLVNSTASDVVPEILTRIPPEEVQAILVKQAVPPMLMTRLVLPLMAERRGGVIVNVSSDAAKTPTPGEAVIGAASAAIKMFSQTVALEAKRYGVRVNAITPSLVVGTEGTDRITAGEGFSAKLFARVATMADLGVTDAHDQAALVVFLASPAAARLTGQAISVNGGISAV